MPYVVLPSKKTQVQRGRGNEGLEHRKGGKNGAIDVKFASRQKKVAQMTKVAIQPMAKRLAGGRNVKPK